MMLMPFPYRTILSRPELRQQLSVEFSTDDAFDGFCLDYFPDVYAQFGGDMTRRRKENILLQLITEGDITAALCTATHPGGQRREKLEPSGSEAGVTLSRGKKKSPAKRSAKRQESAVIFVVLPGPRPCSSLEEAVRSCRSDPRGMDMSFLLALFAQLVGRPQASEPKLLRRSTSRPVRRRG